MVLSSLGPAIVTKRLNWWHEKYVYVPASSLQSRSVAPYKQDIAQSLFLEYFSAKGEEVCNPILEQGWYHKGILVKSPKHAEVNLDIPLQQPLFL
jgi:hypothetical protein